MMGNQHSPGVIPLTLLEVFNEIPNQNNREFYSNAGFVEIHNKKVYDLFDNKNEIKMMSVLGSRQKTVPLKSHEQFD